MPSPKTLISVYEASRLHVRYDDAPGPLDPGRQGELWVTREDVPSTGLYFAVSMTAAQACTATFVFRFACPPTCPRGFPGSGPGEKPETLSGLGHASNHYHKLACQSKIRPKWSVSPRPTLRSPLRCTRFLGLIQGDAAAVLAAHAIPAEGYMLSLEPDPDAPALLRMVLEHRGKVRAAREGKRMPGSPPSRCHAGSSQESFPLSQS